MLRWVAALSARLGTRCVLCGEPSTSLDELGLCAPCATELAPREGGYCPRCATRFGTPEYAPVVCPDCQADPPPWDRLLFHAVYGERLRELVLGYKFRAALGHSRLFQDMAVAAWRRGQADQGAQGSNHASGPRAPMLVVPVPLSRRRLVWRGYNQSLELARRLAREPGLTMAGRALIRVRHTRPQSTLPASERPANLAGAFRAAPEMLQGARVLLVDDVMTTGTTLRECARTLRKAGAATVVALVVARS